MTKHLFCKVLILLTFSIIFVELKFLGDKYHFENTINNYGDIFEEIDSSYFSQKELEMIKIFSEKNHNQPILNVTYAEKIIQAGFEFEEHKIITGDGYILTAWRIPRRIGEDRSIKKKPIILQHGLLDDSWTWLALKTESCLPILLAHQEYDVWLTNSRGNMFSTEHINPDYVNKNLTSKYWNFTWHDMAKYDLPANVEYIKVVTGFEKLRWVGHSQGTLQFYISYIMNPEFMEKTFEKFVSIGTVVTIFNTNSPIVKLLSDTKLLEFIRKFLSDDFLDIGTSYSSLIHVLCTKLTFVCKIVVNLIIETKITNRVDWKEIGDLFYYEPGGTSTKTVLHWIQLYHHQLYEHFDYGKKMNLEVYGSENPPLYDTSIWKNWKIPSYLTTSDSDPFSTDPDTNFFVSKVENKELIKIKKCFNYNHLDYMWSEDARIDLYDEVLQFLK